MNNFGSMTDLEVGGLIQQIKTILINQESITQSLNAIFSKIEENSKEVNNICSQLKTHLDTSDIRIKGWEKTFIEIKSRHAALKDSFVGEKDKNIAHRTAVETTAKNAKWIPILISIIATMLGIANLLFIWGGK